MWPLICTRLGRWHNVGLDLHQHTWVRRSGYLSQIAQRDKVPVNVAPCGRCNRRPLLVNACQCEREFNEI